MSQTRDALVAEQSRVKRLIAARDGQGGYQQNVAVLRKWLASVEAQIARTPE